MTYWKATQPDGTDFYTGEVDYGAALASGEPTPALSGEGEFPGPGWYHLATVPTECVGMSWPCRLFEVEPVGDQTLDTRHPHKIGCAAVRVVRGVDGHIALGPQGAEVVALIGRTRTLTGGEVKRLGAAWDPALVAAGYAALDAAWVAAWDAARDAAGYAARDAAWDAAWDAALDAAGDAALDAAWVAAGLVVRDAAWVAAGDAARDAAWVAAGLVVRDVISTTNYDLLTGLWRSTIGPIHPDDPDWTETP